MGAADGLCIERLGCIGSWSFSGFPDHDGDGENGEKRDSYTDRGEVAIPRKRSGMLKVERLGEGGPFGGEGGLGQLAALGIDSLGDAGRGESEEGDAVFGGPDGSDAGVELMFVSAPFNDVHRRNNQSLGAQPDEAIGDPAVAQVVTDADADLAPGRVPKFLFRGREAILEELDRNAFSLAENDAALRANDKGRVAVLVSIDGIFATDDEVALVVTAPVEEVLGDGAVEGVFAHDEELGLGRFLDKLRKLSGDFVFGREFGLETGHDQRGFGGRR